MNPDLSALLTLAALVVAWLARRLIAQILAMAALLGGIYFIWVHTAFEAIYKIAACMLLVVFFRRLIKQLGLADPPRKSEPYCEACNNSGWKPCWACAAGSSPLCAFCSNGRIRCHCCRGSF